MKSSCIQHPPREPLIVIRAWQIEFCRGSACAAALLSFFEYWHNVKLDKSEQAKKLNAIAMQHGANPLHDESLVQFHTTEELERGILIYKKDTIRKALRLLEELGAITVMRNPDPRYAFDKTRHFIFHPEVLSKWIAERRSSTRESAGLSAGHAGRVGNMATQTLHPSAKNSVPSAKDSVRSGENRPAIPETTSETNYRDRDPGRLHYVQPSFVPHQGGRTTDGQKNRLKNRDPIPYHEIAAYYNHTLQKYPDDCRSQLKNIRTDHRVKKLQARWKEPLFKQHWREVFDKAAQIPFMRHGTQTHPNFRGDFDWLIKNNTNYVKVLEGRYAQSTPKKMDDQPKGIVFSYADFSQFTEEEIYAMADREAERYERQVQEQLERRRQWEQLPEEKKEGRLMAEFRRITKKEKKLDD